jgi:hypothetical protein
MASAKEIKSHIEVLLNIAVAVTVFAFSDNPLLIFVLIALCCLPLWFVAGFEVFELAAGTGVLGALAAFFS